MKTIKMIPQEIIQRRICDLYERSYDAHMDGQESTGTQLYNRYVRLTKFYQDMLEKKTPFVLLSPNVWGTTDPTPEGGWA